MFNVAILGGSETFTALAAEKLLKSQKKSAKKLYLTTVEDIFDAVKNGSAQIGIVPLENYLYGTVRTTFDALFENNLFVTQTIKLPIRQNLIGGKNQKTSQIQQIFGHEQALAQSRIYIKKHFPKAQLISVASSAQALERMKLEPKISASIGPKHAAKDSQVLAKNIEDAPENCTVFAVISKKKNTEKDLAKKKKIFTSMAFYFNKNKPGTLFSVLEEYAKQGINLTRIESRPTKKTFGEYIFYIDVEGSEYTPNMKKIFQKTKKKVAVLKNFGSFETL